MQESRPLDPSISLHQPCFLFNLPIEVRKQIFRYIAISRLDCHSHPRLWRPLGVDGGIHRIGYFDRDTIIPLMLTSHRFHDEVAAVLYGENTFAFHISGLAEGPIWFLAWLAPRYIYLLRRVFIRTGHHVDTYGFRPDVPHMGQRYLDISQQISQQRTKRDLAISVALIKQAWPSKYKVKVDIHATVSYSAEQFIDIHEWPLPSYHLWKMFVLESDKEIPSIEFKRVEWGSPCVKNLKSDGTRTTMFLDGL